MSGTSNPGADSPTPNFPGNPLFTVFESFDGLNIKPTRPAIGDQQMYWCDNLVPLGKNNLVAIPGQNPSFLYTSTYTATIVNFYFFNIKTSFYCFVYFSNGSAIIIDASTSGTRGTVLKTFAAGTFTSTNGIGYSQWGNQYFQIVTSNGGSTTTPPTGDYFLWDGTNLYHSGTVSPNVTILNVGTNYTSAPTAAPTGAISSGATFSVNPPINNQIVQVLVSNPGSGYTTEVFTDYTQNLVSTVIVNAGKGGTDGNYALGISGGTPVSNASGTFDVLHGSVIGINITNGGYGFSASPTLSFSACPGLSGATAVANINATASPQVPLAFSGGGGSGAQAVVNLMPFGLTGTSIENFTGRVWIASQNKINYSSPLNPADFSTTTGGGTLVSSDSFLKSTFTSLIQANGFLYAFADSSVQIISNVSTSSSTVNSVTTVTTTFSNINASPQIGTIWGKTPITYSQTILFVNYDGIYGLYGSTLEKVSTPIDPFFSSIPSSISQITVSTAQTILYGVLTGIVLFPIVDQVTNQTRNALLMWNGKSWFTASQETSFIYIDSQEYNSQLFAYGTDGTNIVQMFTGGSNSGSTLLKTVRSKLYPAPTYAITKRATRIVCMMQSQVSGAIPMTISLDNFSWLAGSNSTTISYSTAGYTDPRWTIQGQKFLNLNVSQVGYVLGFTLTAYDPTLTIQSITLISQQYNVEF